MTAKSKASVPAEEAAPRKRPKLASVTGPSRRPR